MVEPKAEAGDRVIPAEIKAGITKALNKCSSSNVRRTKKQTVRDANFAEVSEALGIPVSELPINKKQPESNSCGGTAAYLVNLRAGDLLTDRPLFVCSTVNG